MDAKKIELGWLEGISPEQVGITASRLVKPATGVKELPDEAAVVAWLVGFAKSAGTAYEAVMHDRLERAFVRACQLAKQGKPFRSPAEAWRLIAEGSEAAPTPGEADPDGATASAQGETKIKHLEAQIASLESSNAGLAKERDGLRERVAELEAEVIRLTVGTEKSKDGKPSGG